MAPFNLLRRVIPVDVFFSKPLRPGPIKCPLGAAVGGDDTETINFFTNPDHLTQAALKIAPLIHFGASGCDPGPTQLKSPRAMARLSRSKLRAYSSFLDC